MSEGPRVAVPRATYRHMRVTSVTESRRKSPGNTLG
jgi:hypothetical protein